MVRVWILCSYLAFAFGCTTSTKSTADQVPPSSEENAALQLWELAYGFSESGLMRRAVRYQAMEWDQDEPDPELRAILDAEEEQLRSELYAELERIQGDIHLLLEAVKLPRADFGSLHRRKGIELGSTRGRAMIEVAAILWVDADRLAGRGDYSSSADRLAAAVRLTGHISDNPAGADGAWTPMTIFDGIARRLERHQAGYSVGDRTRLMRALDQLDPDDPFGTSRGLVEYGASSRAWWEERRQSIAALDETLQTLGANLSVEWSDRWDEILALSDPRMQIEEVDAIVAGYEDFRRDLAAALRDADPARRLADIEDRAEAGEYGLAARSRNVWAIYRNDRLSRERLRRIEAWAAGESETFKYQVDDPISE